MAAFEGGQRFERGYFVENDGERGDGRKYERLTDETMLRLECKGVKKQRPVFMPHVGDGKRSVEEQEEELLLEERRSMV